MNRRFPSLPASIVGVFLTLAALSGCATVDQKITLDYTPTKQSLGKQSGDISVARLDPPSATKNSQGEWIIGTINNVHGVPQANILSDRSIGEWISAALLLELKRSGFTSAYATSTPPSGDRGILITDINAFLNINQGTVSDEIKHELKFNVDVFLKGVKVKTFSVAARDSTTVPLSASPEEDARIMRHSLQDAMQQVIPEIIALTNKP